MSSAIHQIVQDWVGTLPRGLASHIGRVETLAGEFAQAHELEPERVRLCAKAHDLCRWMRGEDLLARARELGIPVHVVEEKNPILVARTGGGGTSAVEGVGRPGGLRRGVSPQHRLPRICIR